MHYLISCRTKISSKLPLNGTKALQPQPLLKVVLMRPQTTLDQGRGETASHSVGEGEHFCEDECKKIGIILICLYRFCRSLSRVSNYQLKEAPLLGLAKSIVYYVYVHLKYRSSN